MSFVVAIMVLIPLRFVEVGNSMMALPTTNVLGAQIQQVVLPNAEVAGPLLEAPYNKELVAVPVMKTQVKTAKAVMEKPTAAVLGAATTGCMTKVEADRLIEAYTLKLEKLNLNQYQQQQTVNDILAVAKNVCK